MNTPRRSNGPFLFPAIAASWPVKRGKRRCRWPLDQTISGSEVRQYRENQEGKSCLIFKTGNRQVLKILRPSYIANERVVGRFAHAARKLRRSKVFCAYQEIVYEPEHDLCYVVMTIGKAKA